ncbi:unnamed protein product [Cuscuta europaea]|uniref:Uncharacterized protein n=1 Tax=Cuscuta europaea TaxID=41803 RepID=A0A9P0ZVR5_CUSEU|nr:unnamed protein product [Cuscuta europaea]
MDKINLVKDVMLNENQHVNDSSPISDPPSPVPLKLYIVRFGGSSSSETNPNSRLRKKYGDNLVSDTCDGLDGLDEEDGEEVSSVPVEGRLTEGFNVGSEEEEG